MASSKSAVSGGPAGRGADDQRDRARADGPGRPAIHPPALTVPHVPLPHVPLPHVSMPKGPAGRVLWWGGLATAAAFGVVDWPVAVLVGAGSWVAEQYAKQVREPVPSGKTGEPGKEGR